MPANHGLGANDVERLPPTRPPPREPNPKRTIEAPEPRSLRAVAEQSELLPERQVLQREIGMGPERCTRGAQESEYEGHCAPASLDANARPVPRSSFGKRLDERGCEANPIAVGCCRGASYSPWVGATPMARNWRRLSRHHKVGNTPGARRCKERWHLDDQRVGSD